MVGVALAPTSSSIKYFRAGAHDVVVKNTRLIKVVMATVFTELVKGQKLKQKVETNT